MYKLLEFCRTDRQRELITAWVENGENYSVTAKSLNISRSTLRNVVKTIKGYAKRCGYDPEVGRNYDFATSEQPVSGYSTLIKYPENDPYGRVLEWVKTSGKDLQQLKAMEVAAEALAQNIPPAKPIKWDEPEFDTDIIPWFNIGDGHIGMLAHDAEIGESFDLKICQAELCEAMSLLIDRAPVTERCVIQDVGDMTHYENMSGTTEASGHALDCDTRFHKMIEVYADVMKFIIERARSKFKYVDVIINQGNHSRTNDHWMSVHLRALYRDEPRVNVLKNVSVFIPYRMGNTFVLCHHFDKCKPAQAAAVMANDFAQDWGETKYHYVDGGHVHSNHQRTEINGCVSESFNQIAGADKYAHDNGYRSRKCLTMVLRSKTYGEKGREIVTAEEVKDRILKLEPGTTAKRRREVYTV